MPNIAPTVLFPGFEFVSAGGVVAQDSIVIPLTDISAVTSAEADPTTGDGREVMRGIIEQTYQQYNALSTENRPVEMTIVNNNSFLPDNVVRRSFNFSFDTDYDASQVNMTPES